MPLDRQKETERPHVAIDAPGSEPPHAQDHWRVNLTEPWEVFFWSREFGCSDTELGSAVRAVGEKAGAVREHLAAQHQQQRS